MVNDVELLNAIKADMGLEGKGIGKRKYVKSGKPRKPRMTKKEKAALEGGLGFKDLLRIPATAAKVIFPPAAIALKAVGLGKSKRGPEGDAISMHRKISDCSGRKPKAQGGSFLDVLKMPLKLLGMGADGVPVEIPLEHVEKMCGCGMTGGNAFLKFLENLRSGYSMPHSMWKLYKDLKPIDGKGYTAAGYTAAGMTGGKKKKGGSILKMASKIANFSPFTSMSADVSPLSHIIPKDLVRDVSVGIVEKMMGKGKKAKKAKEVEEVKEVKEKKAKKVKRAVSPKVARRGELVKKIMKSKSLSFIEASKYVKANNLKY